MAEVLGVELTAETIAAQLGVSDPDLGPATAGDRLEALELRLIPERCLPRRDSAPHAADSCWISCLPPTEPCPPTELRLRVDGFIFAMGVEFTQIRSSPSKAGFALCADQVS